MLVSYLILQIEQEVQAGIGTSLSPKCIINVSMEAAINLNVCAKDANVLAWSQLAVTQYYSMYYSLVEWP